MKTILPAILLFCGVLHAQIPPACAQYQAPIARILASRIGPGAPVAFFAAQMMQESSCNSQAKSAAGALGLTQFMPDTANWIATIDSTLRPADPLDAQWAIRAQISYMYWLANRTKGLSECDTMAFALSSYNGGEGWLHRDQTAAKSAGASPDIWFNSVEKYPDRRRSKNAIAENRAYPRRIVFKLQPQFVEAQWGRGVNCAIDEASLYEHQTDWWLRNNPRIEHAISFFAMGAW